VSNW